MIRLERITKENWEEAASLRVGKDQKKNVASNLYSIAEVQFLPEFEAIAIYSDDNMVGFAMYGIDEDDHNYWIYRYMIDERYQSKGYGKAALKGIIRDIKNRPQSKIIMVGYKPDNTQAARLYRSVGFREEGPAPWGETLAKYE
ncbi:GNAT family N-acetyltransferase [Neobacillus terrae]|uniref:GNAT family N-acetyltransferase n=1 Tax=Neobacillus terrae TaxID=3034837 RepID=UPI00140976CB|nr:GNAT family N-acetyltransferase [Neobacillus terrae]NHM31029.1 GNAT family N-acetyltransferase [Neobacillus terrae]